MCRPTRFLYTVFRIVTRVRPAEKSGHLHSVKLINGGVDDPYPQGCVHEGVAGRVVELAMTEDIGMSEAAR